MLFSIYSSDLSLSKKGNTVVEIELEVPGKKLTYKPNEHRAEPG